MCDEGVEVGVCHVFLFLILGREQLKDFCV